MDRFAVRRAVERLRDGLFDPVAVRHLTLEKDRVETTFSKGLDALEKGASDPLCICGSYGQGKSHTITYLNRSALSQGYATSVISLDVREVPFHQFSTVYRSLMQSLSLPDGQKFTSAWKRWADKNSLELLKDMPHRFKMTLSAILCQSKRLYRPKEQGDWLDKALEGYDIPSSHLKRIYKDRDVEGYREHSLLCVGNGPYFQMVQSLGKLLKDMGYKGWVLFFDEAESIAQVRLNPRIKSYYLLDQFFQTKSFVFPVFAFTNDFFDKVHQEPYEDGRELFPKNYEEAWRDLKILRLSDFSSQGWESLLDPLMDLYSQAYQIELSPKVKLRLQSLLARIDSQETRFKLKALVNTLDIETQHLLLGPSM
jgi:hypothetical protein